MRLALYVCLFLLGILSTHGLDKKELQPKVAPSDETKKSVADTKDKRQISSRETSAYPNEKQDDPEQPQATIYGPKPSQFLIHPLSAHEQQLRNYQPTSRPQSQQLQALGPQLEQSQEIQHFAYLQDISRNHQAKAIAEGKSHTIPKKPAPAQLQQQYAEEQYVQQIQQQQQIQAQAQAHAQINSGQFRPSAYIPQQQSQQQQPSQYQSLQEEQLLKLIEEELEARALQEAQSRASYSTAGPHTRPIPAERQGLNNYRLKAEESPDYAGYSQQQQQANSHQGPQYLPLRVQQQQQLQQQVQEQAGNFYQGPSAIAYRTLPNRPLAESSLEKEIEKLLASNKPSGYRQSHPPAVLASRSPFLQPKSYSTTASPPTTVGQASQYSFAPSVVQYSGFQPSPTVPSITPSHQQLKKFVPTAYSTAGPQYIIENPSPSKPIKAGSSSGQYRVKQQKTKPQQKQNLQNLGPVQFYYNEPQQQQQQQQQQQSQSSQSPPDFHQYPLPLAAPSQSSIYVSQSTGVQPPQKPKSQGSSKPVALPPSNGKPISEAEFQALVDAGYPVQAVPVPVPIPYEQYIKQHPEYAAGQVEIPHRHVQRGAGGGGGVTYLRPLQHERQQQQLRHPREQTEEAVPGKMASS